ncbi:hypothetical protein [Mycobacteroides chelonae]|uniref:hypothetical protein n=1 Tax=Mycobacteroides chelonae TaxID=1774 RepID=UPI0008A91072|nr:hypothetical protein [Mycobacteroides chelonae]OHU12795.1 hypothetical protein BKG75_17420 [Mycobacteroides chelonae]
MGWSISYSEKWQREIGYGVPAYCDQPGCRVKIHRDVEQACGGIPDPGKHGCGLYFCSRHLHSSYTPDGMDDLLDDDGELYPLRCSRCINGRDPFPPSDEHPEWMRWKLKDESWSQWRTDNPTVVAHYTQVLTGVRPGSTRGIEALIAEINGLLDVDELIDEQLLQGESHASDQSLCQLCGGQWHGLPIPAGHNVHPAGGRRQLAGCPGPLATPDQREAFRQEHGTGPWPEVTEYGHDLILTDDQAWLAVAQQKPNPTDENDSSWFVQIQTNHARGFYVADKYDAENALHDIGQIYAKARAGTPFDITYAAHEPIG